MITDVSIEALRQVRGVLSQFQTEIQGTGYRARQRSDALESEARNEVKKTKICAR